jgi:hypothetical protein
MRVAIFFVYLCFLLIRLDSTIYAGTHYNSNSNFYTLIQHVEKKQSVNAISAKQDCFVIEDINLNAEKEYLISDDVEDEDTNNCPAQKYRLLARSHATHAYPSYPSILNYLCNCFKVAPSLCIPASDKYILQGVLRI